MRTVASQEDKATLHKEPSLHRFTKLALSLGFVASTGLPREGGMSQANMEGSQVVTGRLQVSIRKFLLS